MCVQPFGVYIFLIAFAYFILREHVTEYRKLILVKCAIESFHHLLWLTHTLIFIFFAL